MEFRSANVLPKPGTPPQPGQTTAEDTEICPTRGLALSRDSDSFAPYVEEARPIIWPWFFILIGLILIATCMPHIASAYATIRATREPAANDVPADLAPGLAATCASDLGADLELAAVGGIIVLAGASIVVRSRLSRSGGRIRGESHVANALLLDLWKAGEAGFVAVAVIVLALGGYAIGRQLLAGLPLSWAVLEATRLQLRATIVAISSITFSRPILPPGWTT
ncbi:MAG TPA: hypothetical protein VFZ25_06790 [Chloroflexota bacterium]|nr:hypothetical protein [Chloroflexota bacterium]